MTGHDALPMIAQWAYLNGSGVTMKARGGFEPPMPKAQAISKGLVNRIPTGAPEFRGWERSARLIVSAMGTPYHEACGQT